MGKKRKQKPPVEKDYVEDLSLFTKLAIFGDSNLALVGSFLMLVVAILLATSFDDGEPPMEQQPGRSKPAVASFTAQQQPDPLAVFYELPPDDSTSYKAPIVSPAMLRAYQQDGVIAVRGLLSQNVLQAIDIASREGVETKKNYQKRRPGGGTQFFQVEVGMALHHAAFQNAALDSNVSSVAAQLLQLHETTATNTGTMRMLRDILLVKDDDPFICGWHTDDTGFWPATAAAPGVNAWIALDDMPLDGTGGGFALAVQSHTASWREEAHTVTGSTRTLPREGFRDAADMFANRTGSGTCNLKSAARHLHDAMERSMRVYDVKRGDVIFHNRWLFHRTIPFDAGTTDRYYRRYSVRYGPGSSIIPPGYGLELSVLWDAKNGGRTADEVSGQDGPWYPQAWPSVLEQEISHDLPLLMQEKMPVAEAARKQRRKEMKPYLDAMRQQKQEAISR